MAIFKKSTKAKPAEKEPKKTAVKAAVKKDVKKEPKKEVAIATTNKAAADDATSGKGFDLSMVLLHPHVTEKATDLSEHDVYAFSINKRANKMHVKMAVEKLFNVSPIKVAILSGKTKYTKSQKSGRTVVRRHGIKKALVYLKKGDKIEFV